MRNQTLLALSAIALIFLVSFADASGIIADFVNKEAAKDPFAKRQGPSKLALGLHLAPETFPHDNPFNITEEQARDFGIKVIPVKREHWDALVNSSGLEQDLADHNSSSLELARRRKDDDEETDPPNPTDWCTPNKSPGQCTFGAWCHSLSRRNVPNRAWVFYHDCELTGDLHPWPWGSWNNIYSGLPWVTVFYINVSRYPHLKYAGRYWDNWATGWELYYPHGTSGMFYYRRYFDCS